MDAMRHAALAHDLIQACGGVDAIVRANICRTRSSQLYAYQDAGSGQFMPADVMHELEAYVGEPIYSRALYEARPSTERIVELLRAACEETIEAAKVQELILHATAHATRLSPNGRRKIEDAIGRLERHVHEMRQALEQSVPVSIRAVS